MITDSQNHARWAGQLRAVTAQPLQFCPDFPEIAARWEAWWVFRADRPLLMATAVRKDDGIYRGKALHLVADRTKEWLAATRLQVATAHWVADTLPRIRADIGPCAPAAFLGAPLTLSEAEQTSWNTPTITTWNPPPKLDFSPENPWWCRVLELLALTAEDARGKYLVCLPDMAGAIDILVNLRDPTQLCMDIADESREAVKTAAMQVAAMWTGMFAGAADAVLDRGAGFINWVGAWSDRAYTVPTCDFNALIGPDDFEECCLPSLRSQTQSAGRMCFHLDGPQAARHAPALAAQPWVDAVQYTPGAGTPSAMAKVDMLRGLQQAGKPVLVTTPKNEVLELARALDPRGLAIWVDESISIAEADELAAAIKSFNK
ncbi:hypothetical protein OH491_18795 [Termitidicoccus mucosus]|uniref:Uroporphyrinogen decarboxylase (URO-D) domain-containing protein n=1 Tax=Termitidicoccus mucosus TaxID=1184151 RepID=A0A178IK50_9BACT|nr:hypothetical protein AW736_09830 [Opitutaceae bacterium TSB47]